MTYEPAWQNAADAIPPGSFVRAVGMAVANDGSEQGGARWLLSFGSDFLRKHGQNADSPWRAFDLFIDDFEAMASVWPAFERAAINQPIPAEHHLPALARFMVERMPVVWEGPHGGEIAPATKALALADRIDTLVGMFAAGLKPNGSKDPFALRRAAKEVLQMILFPRRQLRGV